MNIHEAKRRLTRLIERIMRGEVRRIPGSARGKISVSGDFDAPLPEELQKTFE